MDTIKIALVDDQLLFRQAMSSLIQNEPGLSLVMEADNGVSCIEQLHTTGHLPDIALIDMEMPDMDGMQLNDELQVKFPSVKVIVLSGHAKERLIARMIHSGACGYLLKNCDKKELITAIHTVYKSGFYITPSVLKAIQSASANTKGQVKNVNALPIDLSKREIEILLLICAEKNAAEIAAQLFISVRTVEGHRNNLLQKTGCRNIAGLVLFAVKYHIIETVF